MATSYSKAGNMTYNPQMEDGTPYKGKSGKQKNDYGNSTVRTPIKQVYTENDGTRYPRSIQKFNLDRDKLHPTQKPIQLLEYLIRTYTNEGATVLDNCMGSGSTGVACLNTDRNFIGIELDENFFNIAKDRIENHTVIKTSKEELW
jgi:site-specific DNA-methyltransferase (adenine-specific)